MNRTQQRKRNAGNGLPLLLALFLAVLAGSVPGSYEAAAQSPEKITVTGRITDTDGEPLPGANVLLKGTRTGASANADGHYSISFSPGSRESILIYSFIGMESQEQRVSSSTRLDIALKSDTQLDAVVVNGFYTQAKETFTGAATTISGEELVQLSPTNLLSGIASVTPGMVLVENNAAGSNPNVVPDILIRGANSLITNESSVGVNNPIVILDGVEISLSELYDLDIFDIERVDVLKDASATILYGEKGANGVIVVERKRIGDEKIKMSYNFVPSYSIPDLSSYHLTDAAQKLEVERMAGLYDVANQPGQYDEAYAWKLQQIRKGVNTNWMKTPLRIPFGHTHSLSLSSRGDKLEFRASASLNDSYGVMKGDNHKNYSVNFSIGYHMRDKLTISYKNSFSMTTSVASPYGSFTQYVRMNPYWQVYDENGDIIRMYWFDPVNQAGTNTVNPLYDATLSSFSKNKSTNYNNSVSGRWNITKELYMTAQGNVGLSWNTADTYVSPETAANLLLTDITKRGSYTYTSGNRTQASGNAVINYARSLDTQGSMFRISGGSNITYAHTKRTNASGIGFLKDELADIKFAMSYPDGGKPTGSDDISTSAGFFANTNLGFRNRYFADVSYRLSASSQFGSDHHFTPFWAFGAGWNVHREAFARDIKWLNSLVLRYSTGFTGSMSFDSYQAKTIYSYASDNRYFSGIGALPTQMGNPGLKFQRVFDNNIGLSGSFWDNRINVQFDYWWKITKDQVMSIELPPSVGVSSMSVNFGELVNRGYDIHLSAQIIKSRNWYWSTTVVGTHTMDKIQKISSSLKNTEYAYSDRVLPTLLFQEGGSQNDIYAMRSAGIDPATGREIFIKKNGEYTFTYDGNERVAVGNTNPILRGTWSNTLRFKEFTLNFSTSYQFGADYYNSTIQSKVEKIDPQYNVDERVFTDRWKQPGDIVRYLSLERGNISQKSERFVERRNEINISSIQFLYDFKPAALTRLGLRKLVVGFGLTDVAHISTVKYERGTTYPYCRSFSLIFRPTF